MCRSRRELSNLLFETDSYSNEYLVFTCKIGFDATENELRILDGNSEIWTGENSYCNFQISVEIGNLNCGAREHVLAREVARAVADVHLAEADGASFLHAGRRGRHRPADDALQLRLGPADLS